MELKDIISVTGMPGLHKILANNKNGFVLESLIDGKRFGSNPRQRVSNLSEIAMFADDEEVKLGKILLSIKALDEGNKVIPTSKSNDLEVKAFMALVLPKYDRERVYTSDMRKLFGWYTLLKASDLDFSTLEKADSETNTTEAESVKSVDAKIKKPLSTPKNTAVRKTSVGAKIKTTTPRKMGS
ncbi:MAG: hypothetical protein CK532_03405 [Flavobacteriales bacterium]|nr:MAG: hypothetical protein CK532_03405 [Flavobacteriales bacterium]